MMEDEEKKQDQRGGGQVDVEGTQSHGAYLTPRNTDDVMPT